MATMTSESNDVEVEKLHSSMEEGGSSAVPKAEVKLEDNYQEPIEVPPCLNVRTDSWEVLIHSGHLCPTHKLRIPGHIKGSFRDPGQESLTLTLLDYEEDAVDAILCDIVVEEGDYVQKKFIGRGWHTFVKDSKVEVGDRLLFKMDSNPGNCYVQFLESDV